MQQHRGGCDEVGSLVSRPALRGVTTQDTAAKYCVLPGNTANGAPTVSNTRGITHAGRSNSGNALNRLFPKSLLSQYPKIVNLAAMSAVFRNCTVFAFLAVSLFSGNLLSPALFAQTSGAVLYSSSVGSLAPDEGARIFLTTQNPGTPVLVAQSTSPAPISSSAILPAGSPSITPVASPAVLPPFDPYVVNAPPPGLGSLFPVSNAPLTQGQSVYSNVYSGNFDKFIPETYEAVRRFREATSFEYTHLPRRGGDNGFGMDEIDIRMQLAFPCRFVPNNGLPGFFYVAPAMSLVWWNGPVSDPNSPGMPPNVFGAFLDFGLQPQFNEQFSLNAWGRVGVFSDFEKVTSDAVRYQGRLEGIYSVSRQLDIHAGVIYYGRANIKLLPTAGIVFAPDENWLLRLVFPDFKIQRRIWKSAQADWWGYVRLDYSGGSWSISSYPGLTDYNDIRLGAGIEFASPRRIGGYVEFGGSFDRELYYGGQRQADLPSVIYLKTGVLF